MKLLILVVLLLVSSTSFSKSKTRKIFQLYRTNYYTEKTMEYALKYDDKTCTLDAKTPVVAYFVKTSSGQYIEGLNKRNRAYFAPRFVERDTEFTSFDFKSLGDLASRIGDKIIIQASLDEKCRPQVRMVNTGGDMVVSGLKRVEVEFNLKKTPPFGMQPDPKDPVSWLKAKGKRSVCLMGSCQ